MPAVFDTIENITRIATTIAATTYRPGTPTAPSHAPPTRTIARPMTTKPKFRNHPFRMMPSAIQVIPAGKSAAAASAIHSLPG